MYIFSRLSFRFYGLVQILWSPFGWEFSVLFLYVSAGDIYGLIRQSNMVAGNNCERFESYTSFSFSRPTFLLFLELFFAAFWFLLSFF